MRLRLLATGDFHIGAGSDYAVPFGPGSRLDDQAKVLRCIADIAHNESVDLILHAGDVFERRVPSPTELVLFQDWLDDCEPVGVVIINGNHCITSPDRPSAPSIFRRRALVSQKPEVFPMPGAVSIATLPWTPVSRLVATNSGNRRDDINSLAARLLVSSAAELRAEICDRIAVLLLHWSVSGMALPTGLASDLLSEPVIPFAALEAQNWDAIVCGHIHSHQSLNENGTAIVVGSPMPLNFAEAREEHGCYLIDLDDACVTTRFLPISSRAFIEIDLECDGNPISDILDFWNRVGIKDAIVKVRVVTNEANSPDAQEIHRSLMQSAKPPASIWRILIDVQRKQRMRAPELYDVHKPGDELETYRLFLESREDEQTAALLSLTAEEYLPRL